MNEYSRPTYKLTGLVDGIQLTQTVAGHKKRGTDEGSEALPALFAGALYKFHR